MTYHFSELHTYHCVIDWLLDADLILPQDGKTLLGHLDGVSHCWDAGRAEEAFSHLARFADALGELIRREQINDVDALTAFRTARQALGNQAAEPAGSLPVR
jgi:hypothetical protein